MPWDEGLNELQRGAVASTSPNVAVVAGPGTGKTRTLLNKALQLIEEEIAPAERIRIVVFTNAGVYDLRKKLTSEVGYSAMSPASASTFHSLALRTLRAARASSVPSPLVVLDDWEEKVFIDELAKMRLGLRDIRIARRLREDYNSRWCIASETADRWLSEGARRQYEEVYTLAKDLLGFTTRGELTFLWWRYLRANPGASHSDVGFPWTHLLVDEYQDLNECEHDILQWLARAGVRVFAVGDPNQSIYETLRHAHPHFCWSFPERVTPGELHVLNLSYRCPAEVLRYGRALLGTEEGVPDPSLAQYEGEARILTFPSDSGERSGLARLAEHLLSHHPASRIMLAVPTRGLAPGFAEEFASLVPVEDRTLKEGEGPEECRLARALLRLLTEPRDSVAAATAIILNCGRTTRSQRLRELFGLAHQAGVRIADILTRDLGLTGPLVRAKRRTNDMLEALRGSTRLADTLRELTGCDEPGVETEELQARIEGVLAQTEQLEPGKVTIMTLHAAKGTEAEWVIIPSVEPGLFERDLVGAPKEERRRLLYVGMTRAIEGLFLSFARRRYGPQRYGDPTGPSARKGPSVFIDEMCDRMGRSPESASEFLRQRLRGEFGQ
jgi:superfamily I DNA/RNA helicase